MGSDNVGKQPNPSPSMNLTVHLFNTESVWALSRHQSEKHEKHAKIWTIESKIIQGIGH